MSRSRDETDTANATAAEIRAAAFDEGAGARKLAYRETDSEMGGMRASGAAASWVVGGGAPLRQPGRRRHPGAPRLPLRRRQARRAQEPFRPHLSGRLRRPPLPAGGQELGGVVD